MISGEKFISAKVESAKFVFGENGLNLSFESAEKDIVLYCVLLQHMN